MISNHKV